MPVPCEELITDPVDSSYEKLRQVLVVSNLPGRRGEPIAHLEGCLLSERAEQELGGLGLSQQEKVHCPQDKAVGLPGSGPCDDEKQALDVADDLPLLRADVRKRLQKGRMDLHSRPLSRKLTTRSRDTTR